MKFVSDTCIKLNKELSELDTFTIDFIKILKKYTSYVIISGYVSILLGRARASEDVDIIISKNTSSIIYALVQELYTHDYYCLNTDKKKDIYEYLTEKTAVRFAKKGTVIPNIELKFAKNIIDDITLNTAIIVFLGKEEICISQLELQIAFKEQVLKSPKDIEDARHMRNIAEGHLNKALLKKYEEMLNEFY